MRKITEEFLLEIFYICFKENSYFQIIREHLKTNYIVDEDYRNTWEQMNKWYNEKHYKPTIGSIIQKLSDENTKGKYDNVISVLQEVKTTILANPEKIITEFEEFIKQNKFIDLYQTTGKLFNENQREKAYAIYIKGSEEIKQFSLAEAKFEKVFGDFWSRRIDSSIVKDDEPFQLPFMIPDLDHATDGGAFSGETELWLGDSGMGKSKLLCGRSIASARSGLNVLHVICEDSRAQARANFDACWTGESYRDIRRNEMSDNAAKAWNSTIRNIGGEIYVKYAEQEDGMSVTITWPMIRNWIVELRKAGIIIHHLVVDYLELVELGGDISRYGSGADGERLRQLQGGRLLKSIAKDFNLLGTTATQSSDVPDELKEDEKFVITRNYLGNAKRKIEPFSYHFTINQSRRERKKGQVRVHADKFREHESHMTWRWKQSLKNSRFFDRKGTMALTEEIDDEEAERLIEEDKKLKKGNK